LSSSDRDGEGQNKHKSKDTFKRDDIDLGSKEAFSLTKGLFPIRTYKNPSTNIKSSTAPLVKEKWFKIPLNFESDKEHNKKYPQVCHWVPESQSEKIFSFSKYNTKIDMIKYTSEEYDQYLSN